MIKKKPTMKRYKFLFILAFAQLTLAQTTMAKLAPVKTSGLHRIFIQPEIISSSQQSMNDFRIYDANDNQVSYQFPNGTYDALISSFVPYKIVSRDVVPNKKTSIVVENPKPKITDITLRIANAEVTKKFSISGSNDLKEWFGLVNQRELSEITNESSTEEFKIIFVPLNSYRYIRFDIDDKKTLPLNILAAGNIVIHKQPNRTAVLKPSKMAFDEDKARRLTRIHVQFDHPQFISQYQFEIAAPNHFNRKARLYKKVPFRYKKKSGISDQTIDTFSLSSMHNNAIYEPFFEKDFYFEIDNRDNPPLKIKDVRFTQKLQWIVADLNANETYTIKTGNAKMNAPDYDMAIPETTMHDSLPEAKIIDISHSKQIKTNVQKEKSLWQKPWFLWTCIVVAALAILYFTASLVKDMKRG
jgi:hypothetical protein